MLVHLRRCRPLRPNTRVHPNTLVIAQRSEVVGVLCDTPNRRRRSTGVRRRRIVITIPAMSILPAAGGDEVLLFFHIAAIPTPTNPILPRICGI